MYIKHLHEKYYGRISLHERNTQKKFDGSGKIYFSENYHVSLHRQENSLGRTAEKSLAQIYFSPPKNRSSLREDSLSLPKKLLPIDRRYFYSQNTTPTHAKTVFTAKNCFHFHEDMISTPKYRSRLRKGIFTAKKIAPVCAKIVSHP